LRLLSSHWLTPAPFDHQVFRAEYIELLLSSLKLEHLHAPSSSSSSNQKESIASLENLRTMLGPFVLRRLKRDVLNQLVEKEDHVVKIQMTETQKALYGDIIQRHMLRRASHTTTKSSSGSSSGGVVDLTGPFFPLPSPLLLLTSFALADAEKLVRNISSSEANNIFTALRKAANHPLLLRVHFSDDKTLDLIATICQSAGHFGDQCDLKRIKSEIKEMSDFDINGICLEYPSLLGHLQLSSTVLYESPKMKKLQTLLPQLIVSLLPPSLLPPPRPLNSRSRRMVTAS
jgi:SWI/SNF-related matrix-associated actin-dependent regulator of chromatin subfamily A containing DEAD/H box 1